MILSLTNPKSEVARGAEALASLLDVKHSREGAEAVPAVPPGAGGAEER